MRKWATNFILPLAMMLGLGGCAINKGDIQGFNLISIEEEKQLGDKFVVEVEKQHKVSTDRETTAYVDRIGRRLLASAREVQFPFTFKVVVDDSINAFAVPGGHIYVNTGLIKAATSEDEVAAVMAHEINHAVARHGTRQMTQQYGYTLVVQLLLGDNPGMLTQLASSLFGNAGTMAYSRSMENQADYLGVETMAKAGYNPNGMLTFFTKLNDMSGQKSSQVEKFFSSHPQTSERLTNVKMAIAQLPPMKYSGAQDKSEFARIKARVK
ncbi:MAG TPA: M48 family metallopeptidase [Geobacteraceae bacterium]|nr:M48 family metallopeptidase [Geobacteraceae bacterium]